MERLHLRTLRVRTACGWQVRHLTDETAWVAELRDRFGLRLPGLTSDELDRLWALTADPAPTATDNAGLSDAAAATATAASGAAAPRADERP
ncbi:hypothetical protein [Arsenicicoccus sp. oral taxon 190]|uniref:hypothetical protein n=1 Tax=Arsenicicoccus sp. oral taxon 190 TaxID=1658671 RepID=UPI00067A0360|nr:hypothetical protein [Arsenicicoccus sp. oral taxon 190]AKT52213.1 hypothetical protein ADJ73_14720 [Arsenicicoccus sp. oral taxon 190]